ncbi:MAG: asparagine synthase [Rhizobiales bacterium]|nr:asparagine synthase [Hyphomicrobiales bacterium]
MACATDAEALLRHPDVPRRINEARIADFLEQLEAIDLTSTFFEGLTRLPPAHALQVENGALRVWRYWQLTPPAAPSRASAQDNAQAFLAIFTEAVRARLRSPEPVGAMLSGGIDSGSVTAIAARLVQQAGGPPLRSFSAIDDDPACPESAGVRAAIGHIAHLNPHRVSLGESKAFRDRVAQLTREQSDPFDGHMAMIRALYFAAQQAGVKVMLDGVAGDTSLPAGDMIAFHLAHGRLRTAWAEAQAHDRFWGGQLPAGKELRSSAQRAFLPGWLQRMRQRRWVAAEARLAAQQSIVHPDLAARIDMPERRRADARHIHVGHSCDPAAQALRMLHPYLIVGRERYDRVAGQCGIEPRDPFLDTRVLEFVLSLPPEQLHAEGWSKLILRRAMERIVPDSVRWKTGRDHIGWRFSESLGDHEWSPETEAKIEKYAKMSRIRGDSALQRSTDGVVSRSDLFYLASWITRINCFGSE